MPDSNHIGLWVRDPISNNLVKILGEYNSLYAMMRGLNYDGDGGVTPFVDPIHGAQVIMELEHSKIHQGRLFSIGKRVTIDNVGGTAEFLIVVPAGVYPHFRSVVVSLDGGPFDIDFYEDTTVSDAGTPVTAYNNNRNSEDTQDLLTYEDPTITDDGILLEPILVPGDRKVGGLGAEASIEWILKTDTTYLIRITNNTVGAGTSRAAINTYWYE